MKRRSRALRLFLAQPADTEAIRRLLACIVKDGMRSGDIANRTRALIKDATRREGMPGGGSRITHQACRCELNVELSCCLGCIYS